MDRARGAILILFGRSIEQWQRSGLQKAIRVRRRVAFAFQVGFNEEM